MMPGAGADPAGSKIGIVKNHLPVSAAGGVFQKGGGFKSRDSLNMMSFGSDRMTLFARQFGIAPRKTVMSCNQIPREGEG